MPDIGPRKALEPRIQPVTSRTPWKEAPPSECPVAATARLLGARWTIQILYLLARPMRFCELQHAIGVNPRTLAQRLRFLKAEGLIEFRAPAGTPRYELTESGAQLVPVLDGLRVWQSRWLAGTTSQAAGTPRDIEVDHAHS